MAYRGLTIIFASFVILLVQFVYSDVECGEGGCMDKDLGTTDVQRKNAATDGCYANGTTVELFCMPYRIQEGPSNNTCNNGNWSNTGPTTCNVYCSPPPAVKNLILNPYKVEYAEGDNVTFSCTVGHKLTPASAEPAQCSNTGNLEPVQELKCIAFECSAPTNTSEHLTWTDKGERGTYYGNETITYSCSDGFKVDGSPDNVCTDQDKWNSDHPTCKSSGNVVQVIWYSLMMTTCYSLFSFYM